MTYQDRTNAIGTLLRETVMPRYKVPDHLDDETARDELRDMVNDLNAEWPHMDETRFAEVSDRMARAVRVTHTSRTWPTISALVKALKTSQPRPVSHAEESEEMPHIFQFVLEWWLKFRQAGPGSMAKQHHALRLVQEGVATPGELRRGGFPIPEEMREEAMAELDPAHPALLAGISALGEELAGRHAPRGNVASSLRGSSS